MTGVFALIQAVAEAWVAAHREHGLRASDILINRHLDGDDADAYEVYSEVDDQWYYMLTWDTLENEDWVDDIIDSEFDSDG